MITRSSGNTPEVYCEECMGYQEIILCTISGTGINCECGCLVGYVNDLCGTGIEECDLVRI